MDGNRRYAKKKSVKTTIGHDFGLASLKKCLEWCFHLGITTISIFAFSIENFNRPKEEVDKIMNLARQNFLKLSEHNEFLEKH